MENEELTLKNKVEKFMSAKIPIHIALKNGRFLNGMVVGKRSEDIYIIIDRKIGRTYVFLEDVYEVTVFTKDNRTLANEITEGMGFNGIGESVSKDEIDLINEIDEDSDNDKSRTRKNK